jgi:L-alanine-DL-glutamate epimerase-like enolase superfamily enzyme
VSQSIEHVRALEASRLAWLEEPVWPPEDHAGLVRVRARPTLPIAAGENAAGVHDLATMLRAESIDICQPSVIKIGGIETVAQAAILARAHGVDYVPHCFYFGPGFLGSLHLAAAFAPEVAFELFFGDLQASPYHDAVRACQGRLSVPPGPGLGLDPDMEVLKSLPPQPPGRDRKLTVCFHSGPTDGVGSRVRGRCQLLEQTALGSWRAL